MIRMVLTVNLCYHNQKFAKKGNIYPTKHFLDRGRSDATKTFDQLYHYMIIYIFKF